MEEEIDEPQAELLDDVDLESTEAENLEVGQLDEEPLTDEGFHSVKSFELADQHAEDDCYGYEKYSASNEGRHCRAHFAHADEVLSLELHRQFDLQDV
ncbi:MAG: hypothetical protein OSA21_06395 [Candidatus Poseidoniaceae archaeon]|nr:hypothetical protein [Candidatus Poseidoniaceae archaeon]